MGKIRLRIDSEGRAVISAHVRVNDGIRSVFVREFVNMEHQPAMVADITKMMNAFVGNVDKARNTAGEPKTEVNQ